MEDLPKASSVDSFDATPAGQREPTLILVLRRRRHGPNLRGISKSVHPRTLAISVLAKWLFCVFDEVLIDPDFDFEATE